MKTFSSDATRGKPITGPALSSRTEPKSGIRLSPNFETKLVAIYQNLIVHGTVLVILNQPATIGAVVVAQHLGIGVAYLPGLTMRRITDMYPGASTTDGKCALLIVDVACTILNTPRSILVGLDQ